MRAVWRERDKLVVGVLRGDLFELADDDGLFLDGGLDLSYEGGVCNFLNIALDVLFSSILYVIFFFFFTRETKSIELRTACARRRVNS